MVNYYKILAQQIAASSAEFTIELQPDCSVYEGHFPNNPVAPGACNLEMVRECASIALGHELRIKQIKQCKFKQVLQPKQAIQLIIHLYWDENQINVTMANDNQVTMTLKMVTK